MCDLFNIDEFSEFVRRRIAEAMPTDGISWVAGRSGISTSTLRRFLKGERNISLNHYLRLAQALDLAVCTRPASDEAWYLVHDLLAEGWTADQIADGTLRDLHPETDLAFRTLGLRPEDVVNLLEYLEELGVEGYLMPMIAGSPRPSPQHVRRARLRFARRFEDLVTANLNRR